MEHRTEISAEHKESMKAAYGSASARWRQESSKSACFVAGILELESKLCALHKNVLSPLKFHDL